VVRVGSVKGRGGGGSENAAETSDLKMSISVHWGVWGVAGLVVVEEEEVVVVAGVLVGDATTRDSSRHGLGWFIGGE